MFTETFKNFSFYLWRRYPKKAHFNALRKQRLHTDIITHLTEVNDVDEVRAIEHLQEAQKKLKRKKQK